MLVAKVLEVDLTIPNSVKEKFAKKKWLVKRCIYVPIFIDITFTAKSQVDQSSKIMIESWMDVSIRICGGCRLQLCVLLGLGLHSEKGCGFLSSHGCFPFQIYGRCLSPLLHTLLGCWVLVHSRLPGSGSSISLQQSPHGKTCRSLEESTLLRSWSGSMDL